LALTGRERETMQKTATARQMLDNKFGGAAFVARLPLYEKYFVLARVADEAGRKKAAYKMGVYAAVECHLEGHPPFGFLQGYGLTTSDSRLARGLAMKVCAMIGGTKMEAKLMGQENTDIREAVHLASSCEFAPAFVKRRAREADMDKGRKALLKDAQRTASGSMKKILNAVELAKYSESMMDQVLLKPESEN